MKKALIKGTERLVTVETLISDHGMTPQEKGIETVCPVCSEPVYVYGAISLVVAKRFHHYEGGECILSPRVYDHWVKASDWDFERGQRIRKILSEGDALKKLYTFCNNLCGRKKRLGIEKFNELVSEADRRNLWCYKDIPLWVVPYLLLTLRDFQGYGKELKKPFVFRFLLKEKPPKDIKEVWESERFHLLRVFEKGRQMDYPPGNPYALTKEIWEQQSKDYHWLGEEKYKKLLQGLEKAFLKSP